MKKLAVKDASQCAYCFTCENACAMAFYKTEDITAQDLSCIHVTYKDDKVKIVSCVQCGKCAKACESEAITKNAKGVYTIDNKKCVDCGKCVEACPFKVLVKSKNKDKPSKCIACGICAKQCPQEILYIKEEA